MHAQIKNFPKDDHTKQKKTVPLYIFIPFAGLICLKISVYLFRFYSFIYLHFWLFFLILHTVQVTMISNLTYSSHCSFTDYFLNTSCFSFFLNDKSAVQ